ncbi:MAG TPA: prenyltransferase/squalene oxidase repeat-containing protein [Bryobacteraceae bacterium]|nr:prenyltransferase/squalene oxidase repeat-containing protein [Bryobacteraceae bacterium]
MKNTALLFCAFSTCLAVGLAATNSNVTPATQEGWNKKAAASYLDNREGWWLTWPKAQRDHGTACVSCHTAVPYALARPVLRGSLGEKSLSASEQGMLANITKRVSLWNEMEPFYNDAKSGPGKSVESRNAESVLNAVILAQYDASQGKSSDVAKKAFDNMWALQSKTSGPVGAWVWQNFHLAPWEGDQSEYWGATMAALATAIEPDHYSADPKIQENLTLLRHYLVQNFDSQPVYNKVMLLWTSTKLPGLLTPEKRAALEDTLYGMQQADGGWSMTPMGPWKRKDNTPEETKSDGLATGLTVFALEEAGVARSQEQVKKGLEWLLKNQDPADGSWVAYSVNKKRDPASDAGRFMSDSATSFAVLALETEP